MDAALASRSAITSRLSAIDTTRDPAASAANANLMSRRISCNRLANPFNSFMIAIPAERVCTTEPTMHRDRSPKRYNNSQVVKENLTWLPLMTGCRSARCVGFLGRELPSSTIASAPITPLDRCCLSTYPFSFDRPGARPDRASRSQLHCHQE
jgi:hypothetical protein